MSRLSFTTIDKLVARLQGKQATSLTDSEAMSMKEQRDTVANINKQLRDELAIRKD